MAATVSEIGCCSAVIVVERMENGRWVVNPVGGVVSQGYFAFNRRVALQDRRCLSGHDAISCDPSRWRVY